jgi:hypothetical protein
VSVTSLDSCSFMTSSGFLRINAGHNQAANTLNRLGSKPIPCLATKLQRAGNQNQLVQHLPNSPVPSTASHLSARCSGNDWSTVINKPILPPRCRLHHWSYGLFDQGHPFRHSVVVDRARPRDDDKRNVALVQEPLGRRIGSVATGERRIARSRRRA